MHPWIVMDLKIVSVWAHIMIVINPKGGLCNRLRVINSGLGLSKCIERPLKVLWYLSPECHCSFYSLFQKPDDFDVVDLKAARPIQSKVIRKFHKMCDRRLLRLKYQRVLMQDDVDQLLKQKYDFNHLCSARSVYICCCNRFYEMHQRFPFLKPIPSLQQIVDRYTGQYDACTVGVHIRRTDHRMAIQHSFDAGFIDAMKHEIQHHPNVKFYVASDSPDVMSRFTELFSDRIIWHPKEYRRDTPKGVQDALIDLLCLSKTTKVIGSYYSSFSETAAQIHRIPLQTIK
jgi:hypothetical protein